jgi:hypothetical protein
MLCQLMGITVSTCDFRTQPSGEKTSEINNMTKEEVIDGLKHRIQQKDPVFRKQFLSISKEPDVKINQEEFRKVQCCPLWGFLPALVRVLHPTGLHTSFTAAAHLFHGREGVGCTVEEFPGGATKKTSLCKIREVSSIALHGSWLQRNRATVFPGVTQQHWRTLRASNHLL